MKRYISAIIASLSVVGYAAAQSNGVCTDECLSWNCKRAETIQEAALCAQDQCNCVNAQELLQSLSTFDYCKVQHQQDATQFEDLYHQLDNECANKAIQEMMEDSFQCFDGSVLSPQECQDLFKIALFRDVMDEHDLMRTVHGPHKTVVEDLIGMQRYKELQDNQQALFDDIFSLASNDRYRSRDNKYNKKDKKRGFSLNDFLQKLDVKITLNETALMDFIQDFQGLQMEYEALRRQRDLATQKLAQDKYAETVAKLQLEWANLVRPSADAFVKLVILKLKEQGTQCDFKCMQQNCYKSGTDYKQYMVACDCKQQVVAKELRKANQALEQDIEDNLTKVGQEFTALDYQYKQKEMQLTYKYYDFLERQAVSAGGCDPICVNKCTDINKYPLNRVNDCLERCTCEGGIIKVTEGDYDINLLSMYAKDQESFAYFKENFKL